MKYLQFIILPLILLLFTSCEAVKGIFKAGMGFGIFLTVAVIVLIIYAVIRLGGKK